jgi:integrase
MAGLSLPREKNVRRPVATAERYRLTMAEAHTVDPSGRLAGTLALARYTGRRINAICQLRTPDLLLSREAVERSLAATGQDPALVRFMPNGAILWRATLDKQGYENLTPLSREARAALDAYLRAHPRVGNLPVFPARSDNAQPWNKLMASYYLRRAETAAGLPRLERGGFHTYRRLWASERKHLPDVDVAKAGGWRDLDTMKRSYQQADPATVLRVIENAPESPDSGHSGQDVGKAVS